MLRQLLPISIKEVLAKFRIFRRIATLLSNLTISEMLRRSAAHEAGHIVYLLAIGEDPCRVEIKPEVTFSLKFWRKRDPRYARWFPFFTVKIAGKVTLTGLKNHGPKQVLASRLAGFAAEQVFFRSFELSSQDFADFLILSEIVLKTIKELSADYDHLDEADLIEVPFIEAERIIRLYEAEVAVFAEALQEDRSLESEKIKWLWAQCLEWRSCEV